MVAEEEAPSGPLVKGFKLLRLPVVSGSPVARCLLVKKHEENRTQEDQEGAGRTLFVTHVDNLTTEAQLQTCFNAFGPVEKVVLKCVEKKASKAEQKADLVKLHVNFARVIFKAEDSLQKALAAANGRISSVAVLPLPGPVLKEQMKLHRIMYRDSNELREEIDTWMASYDAREDERRQALRDSAVVDDDGFTKVVTGVTKTGEGFTIRSAARSQIQSGAFHEPIKGARDPVTQGDKRKRKKKEKERPDFYRFQQREKRRDEIIGHRKRLAEDAEKVDRMRATKRFKAKADKAEARKASKAGKTEDAAAA